jgi:hypothetical protein
MNKDDSVTESDMNVRQPGNASLRKQHLLSKEKMRKQVHKELRKECP